MLRESSIPAALDRDPEQEGFTDVLLRQLLEDPEQEQGCGPEQFMEIMETICENTRSPPVLVLDQFENVFTEGKAYEKRRDRIALLLALTVQQSRGGS
ncbi:MAG: hypothetical protein MJE77_28515 [Proteobacteria bacterium]|nr:hypothetical protein [Pseudomonadota bacterium]